MRIRILLVSAILSLLTLKLSAQDDDVRPTLRYESGEVVKGVSGVQATIPENWSGVLPRGIELFLLVPNDGSNGEIYVSVAKTIPTEQRKANWLAGLDLGNGNVLKSDGNISSRDGGGMSTNLVLDQKTSDRKGYLELSCGDEFCLTATLLSSPQDFDKLKGVLFKFLNSIEWSEPGTYAPYADFDWNEFLTGKHVLNKEYIQKGKSQNDVWLCPDGRFTTKLKRSGMAKGEAREYKGSNSGTWETTSVGPTGVLVLNYKKLPPLEVNLEIRNEQIYLNGKRHYAIVATNCGGK